MLATLGPGSVFVLSSCFVALALYQISRLEFRSPPAAGAMDGPLLDARRIMRDIGEGFSYLERDARVAFVMALVGLHCGLTMAFDSMMPTLATSVGGADRTYSANHRRGRRGRDRWHAHDLDAALGTGTGSRDAARRIGSGAAML